MDAAAHHVASNFIVSHSQAHVLENKGATSSTTYKHSIHTTLTKYALLYHIGLIVLQTTASEEANTTPFKSLHNDGLF